MLAPVALLALALPLAMTEGSRVEDAPPSRFVLTRRSLILALTVGVSVATWYSGPGLSFVAIAVLVLGVPVIVGVTRWAAARRGRLEPGLLRNPCGRGSCGTGCR